VQNCLSRRYVTAVGHRHENGWLGSQPTEHFDGFLVGGLCAIGSDWQSAADERASGITASP